MSEVTVSIFNTNGRELLLACLDSLHRSLTGEVAVEIAVLDNASEDGSVDAVRERFPGVRVIPQQFRAGFPANHNRVIRETSGRYVFVLNEDTASDDWGFARLVAALDRDPHIGALGPKLAYPDGRQQPSAWRFPSPLVSLLGVPTVGQAGIRQSRGEHPPHGRLGHGSRDAPTP